jgi:hypothetical protein
MERKINRYKKKSLSNHDVLNICNNKADFYTYPEIVKFKTLDQLLGRHKAVILLYLTKKNYGHFCALLKQNPNTISFFDSYGLMPDDELKFAPMHFRKKNNQYKSHLTKLMYDSGYNIDYNDHKLQSKKNDIATCGRWTGLRILFRNLTNDKFANLFTNEYLDPDELITAITIDI